MDLDQLDAAGMSLEYLPHEIVDLTSDDESAPSVAENLPEDAGQGSDGEEASEGEVESEVEGGSEIWESESLLEDVLEELTDDNVFHSGKSWVFNSLFHPLHTLYNTLSILSIDGIAWFMHLITHTIPFYVLKCQFTHYNLENYTLSFCLGSDVLTALRTTSKLSISPFAYLLFTGSHLT
jgi:hypothetical protein